MQISFFSDKFNYDSYFSDIILAGKEIYQESLKSKCVKNESYNLIIWISLLWSNKKSKRWFNQTDLTIFLLKELQKYFPKIFSLF